MGPGVRQWGMVGTVVNFRDTPEWAGAGCSQLQSLVAMWTDVVTVPSF